MTKNDRINANEYQKNKHIIIASSILLFSLIVVFILNVCIGSISIPLKDLSSILMGNSSADDGMINIYRDILIQIRLPRIVAALLLGGALALSGYMLQTFFHNPIAGPFVLGISSGAKLLVALLMVLALSNGFKVTSIAMIFAAFIGAMISMAFVLLVSKVVDKMSLLVVAGIMIGYICSAVTDFVVTFADDSNIVNLHNWSLGSFSGISWENVYVMSVIVLIVLILCVFMSKPVSAYMLGEVYAQNMGVDVKRLRTMLVILSSFLAATVTAFAGPISFVGIAVPHITKGLFKTTKPLVMIPACFVCGGVFCMLCDLISRSVFAPTELAVSTVTAVLGAPVVIYIMTKRKG